MKITVKIQFLQNTITINILSKQQYLKQVKKNFDQADIEFVLGFSLQNQIFLNQQNIQLGILVHEIVHSVDYLLQHHNIQDKEVRAYLTQYVLKYSIKKIQKHYKIII